MSTPTYRELYQSEMGCIASYVATDLLTMNNQNDLVSDHDMAKIEDARRRDAAIATMPRESSDVFATATKGSR